MTDSNEQQTSVLAVDTHALEIVRRGWDEALESLKSQLKGVQLDASGEQWASDTMNSARAVLKGLEDERQALTRPLLDDKQRIDEIYRKTRTPIEDFVAVLKGKLGEAAQIRDAAQRAALAAAQQAANEGDHEACQTALSAIPEAVSVSGASTTMKYEARVVDLGLVPREYLQVNEAALKMVCKACDKTGRAIEIPGIQFVRVPSTRATGGKRGKK